MAITREWSFMQAFSRRIIRFFIGPAALMKDAAKEAQKYYDESSMTKLSHKNIMYWEGYQDGINAIETAGAMEVRDWLVENGADQKGLYLAYYMMQAIRHYEDVVKGVRDPLIIEKESFSLFHDTQDYRDDDE